MIRFWDTSALVKVYRKQEPGHGHATRLLSGRTCRGTRHATSMLVLVELTSVLVRECGDRTLVATVLDQLRSFAQMEFTETHRDMAVRLAMRGMARGADTAIGAQAVVLAGATKEPVHFVTADKEQARLVGKYAKEGGLNLEVVFVPNR